jgi:hypothetical protein
MKNKFQRQKHQWDFEQSATLCATPTSSAIEGLKTGIFERVGFWRRFINDEQCVTSVLHIKKYSPEQER